ncbi:hypothetical protein KEM56_004001 [Ascosphaera pollenicola]|nr:hypothetical protein KEM56_004001 [Ascosphaera pollenicola]
MLRVLLYAWAVIGFSLLRGGSAAGAADDDTAPVINNQAEAASNNSLLWGPYRPNLYFGVRPRIPKSLMTGLLWAKVDDFENLQANFRYTCEQNEGMHGYGWDEYDIRTGGRQTIHDTGNSIDLTIDFVKIPGGKHGGSWAARIKGEPREDANPRQPTTVVFYASMEGNGRLALENEPDPMGYEDDVTLAGSTEELGEFRVDVTRGPDSNNFLSHDHPSYEERPLTRTMVSSLLAPADAIWRAKGLLFAQLQSVISGYLEKYGRENIPPPPQMFTIPNSVEEDGNIYYIQKTFSGKFEFDILFSSASAEKPVTSEVLTETIEQARSSFAQRFKKIFTPVAPFTQEKYEEFSKSMFSNLVGGIGYFFGNSIVDRSYAPEYEEENEGFWEDTEAARARAEPQPEGAAELFTAIPSRPFFPRGFLWDEGFHLIPIMEWDLDLTLQITKSWFSLMDDDGWIAREQILGPEARSKVPAEFQVQYPHYANPPTLFLIIESLAEKVKGIEGSKVETDGTVKDVRSVHLQDRDALLSYLNSIYPLLKRQYFWFRKTQHGDLKSYEREAYSLVEGYRWRGRSVRHILTSGLDDYPRPQPPHPGELHVDLISWVGMMTRSLKNIAEVLGLEDDIAEFDKYETAILKNIEDLHWDEKERMYCDATIDDYEEHVHVCHKGYISLFPFMTGLMDAKHPHLGAVLDLIADPEELWSPYGIRSLSKSDEASKRESRGPARPVPWGGFNLNILISFAKVNLDKARFLPSSPPLDGNGNEASHTTTHSQSSSGFQSDTAAPSSDPPLFSSDDLQCSALENYYPKDSHIPITAEGTSATPDERSCRRKRAYRGTWWGEEITPKRTRTEWRSRGKVDSGVFMGSDDDDDDQDDDCELDTPKARHTQMIFSTYSTPVRRSVLRHDHMAIKPEPENILFLNTNELESVSPEVFELKTFKFLNLFRNNLTQIPDCIEKVERLEKLNIAGNQLRTLPWSIMKLITQSKLKHLIALPNPFVKLGDVPVAQWFCETMDGQLVVPNSQEHAAPALIARSCIEHLDSAGYPSQPPSQTPSYSHTLRETALRAYLRAIDADSDPQQIFPVSPGSAMEEGSPPIPSSITSSLEKAIQTRNCGGNFAYI